MRKSMALALICASLAAPSLAQDGKASKEKEALRRAQMALRAAQEQQSSLMAERDRAEAQAASARKEVGAARALHQGAAARLKATEAEAAESRSQLQATRQSLQDAQALAAERDREQQQQVLALRQESAARLQANLALTELLQRSTKALADAESKNHQLHAIGQDLVRRWLDRKPLDTALLQDPVLGLTAVRFEDQAEALRSALEAHRLVR